ncbi:MAG: hypothetical protein H7317_01500 [Pseudorhodobacter sp.]|nr:hypothetical protein [Pseudorhodobacter sp.]
MMLRVIPLVLLTACSTAPVVSWPAGQEPITPALLPASELTLTLPAVAQGRGAALAAEAAALQARAAAMPSE